MSTKRRRIPVITKHWLAVILVLVLLPCVAMAEDTGVLNEQLIEAAKRSETHVVKSLLDKGANINAQDQNGWTALMWCASHYDLKMIKLLLDKGADINQRDHEGSTVLTETAGLGYREIMKQLLEKKADPDSMGTALLITLCRRDRDITNLLRQAGAKFKAKSREVGKALTGGVKLHDPEMIMLLLDQGADINSKGEHGWTPLDWAVWVGDLKMVELLLDKGADAKGKASHGRTVLMEAAARDYLIRGPWYSELWDTLKRVYWSGGLGPRYHSGRDDAQIVALLLQRGADVNARDIHGDTALKRAHKRGSKEIVELLKAHGAKE